MSIATADPRSTVDTVPAAVRRALVDAPAGEHALVEAALAWRRLQPVGDPPAGPARAGRPGHQPIVVTGDQQVATRVARLLSPLTFAVIADAGPGSAETRWRVDVPVMRHRPVTRTLATVWRETRRRFGPDARLADADRDAAISLWRIAVLIAEPEPGHDRICFRPGTVATGELLVTAAARLGVQAGLRRLTYRPAVLVEEPGQVRGLLRAVLPAAVPQRF